MASWTGWSGRPGDPAEDLREWWGWEPGGGASWLLVLHTLPMQNTQTLTLDTYQGLPGTFPGLTTLPGFSSLSMYPQHPLKVGTMSPPISFCNKEDAEA